MQSTRGVLLKLPFPNTYEGLLPGQFEQSTLCLAPSILWVPAERMLLLQLLTWKRDYAARSFDDQGDLVLLTAPLMTAPLMTRVTLCC